MPDNRLPTNQSQLDIVEKLDEIKDAIAQGGGGGTGGHTIIDENGNSMTARAGLQFVGAVEVTDDSANNRTLVEVLGGDFYNPVIYSTEEREIGVWTDGKPLYEKTIPIQALQSSAGQTSYPHSISNIEHIIDYVATINFNNANGTYARFDRVGTAGNSLDFGNTFSISVDKTNINIIVGKDRSACSVYVTVRYTKTTDTAGSGSWTPQGVPTHHYSTDEKVIGTWIDGKTLYEKTIDLGQNVDISYNSWTEINADSTGLDLIVDVKGTNAGGTNYDIMLGKKPANNKFEAQTSRNGYTASLRYLTIQYTKSS